MKHFETMFLCVLVLKSDSEMGRKFWLCTGQMKSQLSYGQCSKTGHLLTIVQLLWMVHMCLHVLGMICQT